MKTTSYEISKQLAEAGFSEQVGFLDYYFNTDKELRHRDQESYSENTRVDCFSYDLETILEALPEKIINKEIDRLENFVLRKTLICYDSITDLPSFICYKQENESLADTAARLLLLLHEKNLI